MCAMLMGVPAGKPVRLTVNVAVPPVTLPAASFVVSNTIVALPLPVDSALLTGGTSLAGRRSAVNVGLTGVGAVSDFEQAAEVTASAARRITKRFMRVLLR